jgi:DNA-directed RNA polymerase alpha subunit
VKSDLIDVMVQKHAETAKAVLVSDDGDREKAVWIPLSQCEIAPSKSKDIFELTLPEWLAKDKGLI